MSTSTGASLTAQLAHRARQAHGAAVGAPDGADPVVLARRADTTVVRSGAVVAKAHDPGGDPALLAARLRVAAHPLLRGVLLAPLPHPCSVPPPRTGPDRGGDREPDGPLLGTLPGGHRISLWPYGVPVDPGAPGAAPWEAAGALLARLHRVPLAALPGPLPPMRGPARVARALELLRREVPRTAAARTVAAAGRTLPAWALGAAPPPRADALCHGDLHLGQLVRHPAPGGPWQLIDVDDLGPGDPAWDLARPAAWFAAGLLPPADFGRFLTAYRAAGGPAVPGGGPDPWPWLDVPARALTVQTAARSLARAAAEGRAPDEIDRALVDACSRIARSPAGPGPCAGRGRRAPGHGG
ncbi:aminoglycoside phosphotransferase family protein [Streptomyces sp. TRM 70361]|uniref:phosphotransferase family protein n=1 Tax=Streptomyces sp. TRM 70361 TaxID=3116553 RepID=UPI002E7B16FD|nr:aminoglycoside phosphotransferase family protein [Streptomyces sp. TRM 70361]MEE1939084.1 aminoglycoside phosphotransferase family protein [Streptomyces sp. TRM 70361]